jgi:DDE superfamily endonuclease
MEQPVVPTILVSWLAVFRPCFTAPVWNHILVLVGGAVLAPGKRTVTQALRVMGLADRPGFGRYTEVLNRARWDARDVARRLLLHLLAVLLPNGEVVIGIDDTIERRWGGKIKARGIYRDAVRSSHGHFVKTSGLRWLSLAVMVPVPFAGRRWALPFLTVLAPSARWSEAQGKRHKALTDWAKQAILQTKRWLPNRRNCYGRRRRFLGLGTHRGGASARLFDHQVASRRQLIRAGPETPQGSISGDPLGAGAWPIRPAAQAFLCTDLDLEPTDPPALRVPLADRDNLPGGT